MQGFKQLKSAQIPGTTPTKMLDPKIHRSFACGGKATALDPSRNCTMQMQRPI